MGMQRDGKVKGTILLKPNHTVVLKTERDLPLRKWKIVGKRLVTGNDRDQVRWSFLGGHDGFRGRVGGQRVQLKKVAPEQSIGRRSSRGEHADNENSKAKVVSKQADIQLSLMGARWRLQMIVKTIKARRRAEQEDKGSKSDAKTHATD